MKCTFFGRKENTINFELKKNNINFECKVKWNKKIIKENTAVIGKCNGKLLKKKML